MSKFFTVIGVSVLFFFVPYSFGVSFWHKPTVDIGLYNNWGEIAFRDKIPRPIVFNTRRKAEKNFMVSVKREATSFVKNHLDFNIGFSANFSSIKQDNIFALSLFPELEYVLFPSNKLTPFVNWSIAGISYLNKDNFNNEPIAHFLFQDYLSVGLLYDRFELSLMFTHYSGGGILTKEKGYDIPYTIALGYKF